MHKTDWSKISWRKNWKAKRRYRNKRRKRNGKWKKYYENGNLLLEVEYTSGKINKKGKENDDIIDLEELLID